MAMDPAAQRPRPPNILYIFTDDQSTRTVGCYPEAHPWVKTPNIDRLAAEGVRFTTCYTGAWCAPSRATALSGKLQHGLDTLHLPSGYPNYVQDPDVCPWWPRVFRAHGWVTGVIGKWHTGSYMGYGRDWDFCRVWNYSRPGEHGSYYSNQWITFDGDEPHFVGGYSTDNYTEYALEFLRQRGDDERPWYLWLCYDGPHTPHKAAERHEQEYRDIDDVPTPDDIYPPRPTKCSPMRIHGHWRENDDGEPILAGDGRTLTDHVAQYNRPVRSLDEGVGRILEQLEAMGQLDNTLIIYTSDQGFAWGQHGMRHKFAPYDAALLAPMIMRLPGTIPAGSVCETTVGGQDMPPTFFRLAGIDLPWKMHGHDLTPLLCDPGQACDRPFLLVNTHHEFGQDSGVWTGYPSGGLPWWLMVRQGSLKYIRYLIPGEIEELYDLDVDPDELVNLALKPEWHAKLAELRQVCLDELARTDAPTMENLPPVLLMTEEQLLGGV